MGLLLLALGIAGVFVGVLSGLLGIGGGVVMVPLLRLAFGLDALVTTGTSLLAIIPTSVSGIAGHLRNKTVHVRDGVLIGIFGALASPLGSVCASLAGGIAVMCAAAAVVLFSSYKMIRKALKSLRSSAACETADCAKPAASPSSADPDAQTGLAQERGVRLPTVAGIIACGIVAGFASGFIGVGGGFIIVPILTLLFSYPMSEASGTSLVAVLILAIPGAITHGLMGQLAISSGLALAAGAVPGAYLGAMLAKRINDAKLRLVFGIILALAGAFLVANELM